MNTTEKRKWSRAEALAIAEELVQMLTPYVERIEIAGSIRRNKPLVGDIEILFIPRMEERQLDMFTTGPMDIAHEYLGNLLANGTLSKRPSVTGSFTWAMKNKLAIYRGIPVDFFATTAENWWVSLVVRTGSKETNLRLTTGARQHDLTLMAYGCGVRDLRNDEVTPATSERHVFDLCHVHYLEPHER